MTDLPTYSGVAGSCPTCTGEATSRWHPLGTRFKTPLSPDDTAAELATENCPEWMLRTCLSCRHRWPEAVPDPDPARRVADLRRELARAETVARL